MIDLISFLDPKFILTGIVSIFTFPFLLYPHVYLFGPLLVVISQFFSVWPRLKKLILLIGVVIFVCAISLSPIFNYLGPLEWYIQGRNYIDLHRTGLVILFNQDFDAIANCHTYEKYSCDYPANQSLLDAIDRDNTLIEFESTYFVRLSPDGKLQRLHINGGFEEFQPTTRNEKLLVQFINSNSPFLLRAFIDEGYYPGRFLKGFGGELDIPIPVQVNGKTIGVLVRLFAS